VRATLRSVAVFTALVLLGGAGYTVRPGDTLSSIAGKLGVGVGALARANSLPDPNHLIAGRTLQVPAAAAGSVRGTGLPARLAQSPTRQAYIPVFKRWAAANGIPADLLMATTWLESGWQNQVVSPVGAVGIGQLMPATVRFIRSDLIGVPTLDPRRPEDNIRMSARYLRFLLAKTRGDVRLTLAGYYQGLGSVQRSGMYASTVLYVDGVQSLRPRFRL
jgi:soluble lytic murein transglycosylase-like protein